jgi:hypothetical protein
LSNEPSIGFQKKIYDKTFPPMLPENPVFKISGNLILLRNNFVPQSLKKCSIARPQREFIFHYLILNFKALEKHRSRICDRPFVSAYFRYCLAEV